jgi:hypothetical protein
MAGLYAFNCKDRPIWVNENSRQRGKAGLSPSEIDMNYMCTQAIPEPLPQLPLPRGQMASNARAGSPQPLRRRPPQLVADGTVP